MQTLKNSRQIPSTFSWQEIDTVLLDLDGTLLDKYFDDFFWEEFVPKIFAERNNLDISEAQISLLSTYKKIENTLEWTDLDYWSKQLNLNIPQLKKEVSHIVAIRPQVIEFLEYLKKKEKKIYLVTNAHPKTLEVKFERTDIARYFTAIFSSKSVEAAKEQPEFWNRLEKLIPFTKSRTLFVDDTEKVLQSARRYGIHHLLHIAQPSSKLPAIFSPIFPSIINFEELM